MFGAVDENALALSRYSQQPPRSASAMATPPAMHSPGCPCMGLLGQIDFCQPVVRGNHPPWSPPASAAGRGQGGDKGLRVINSLTGELEPFVPATGNKVLWYTCGPTVYDTCHMGHARAYLTFDILRRILEDHFGFDVLYHVNITDIDDKIILRARQNHLVDVWTTEVMGTDGGASNIGVVSARVAEALEAKRGRLAKKRQKLEAPLPEDANSKEIEEWEKALKEQALKEEQFEQLSAHVAAVQAENADLAVRASELIKAAGSELGELLDAEQGATVTAHEIFDAHSREYEKRYLEDMDMLGVRPPDVLTRVTEYVDEIIAFVGKIVDKGLAYSANGSVYLSIEAFKAAGHHYRKLEPHLGDTSEADMAEGEGALGTDAAEKRHPNDFALWKASKPGEPSWESPWGGGRPGWHIECSVIASDILGPNLDIHAGGVDLKFPHHDNELAQAEAYFGHNQWVNYFFHAGHLSIKGLKMSKSLKNFITIRQALADHTPRQLRLMFLLQSWHRDMQYSDQAVADARSKESLFRNFFGDVKDVMQRQGRSGKPAWLEKTVGWSPADRELNGRLMATEQAVHEGFCDNFDTKTAVEALCDLVNATNKYMREQQPERPAVFLLRKVTAFVTKTLRTLGVVEGADNLGFPVMEGGANAEDTIRPYLDTLRDFRFDVRAAMRDKDVDHKAVVLQACDRVRDEVLPKLGVRLEDISNPASSRWKLDDPVVLMKEIEDKKRAQAEAEAAKAAKDVAKAEVKLAAALAAAVPPNEILQRTRGEEFGTFGDDGLPVTDAKGEPVPKAALKKLKKVVDKQQKDHAKLLKESNGDVPGFIQALEETLEALRASM